MPPDKPGKQAISVSRPNFIESVTRLTVEDEKAFEHLWRYLGLSVDWSMTYATIGAREQRVSQLMFVRLLRGDLAYQLEAPTLWDVDFRTAVAQAELEDREQLGAYHRIRFESCRCSGSLRLHRDYEAGAHPRLRRPGGAPRRRTIQAAVRVSRADAALRRARAGAGARPRRSREGERHRDDLHLRRHHRRHLVARAEAARPRHRRPCQRRAGR
ncbi:MAG: class I tRNA ligase family protein [Vicinamibacterales bacterium]